MASLRTRLAALTTLLFVLTSAIAARGADDSGKKPDAPKVSPTGAIDRFEVNVKSLKLTDDQKPKIDAFFAQARQDLNAIDPATDPAQRDKQSRQISAKLRNQINDLLTNEQKAELIKKMTPAIDTDAMIDRIKKNLEKPELKLTADQKTKIDALLDDTKKKLSDLRTEARDTHADIRPKIQEVLADMQKQLSAILSPGKE